MHLSLQDSIWGMTPVTAVATLLILVLGVVYYYDVGVPPGPRGLPYIGYWPFLSNKNVHLELHELGKIYGDIFSFTMTGHLFIHFGSIKAVKEAYLTKGDCFTQRYQGFSLISSLFSEGIVCLRGEQWKVQRKFFINAFREFGFGSIKETKDGSTHIYEVMMNMVAALKAEQGKSFNITPFISWHCSAVLLRTLLRNDGITHEELDEVIEWYRKALDVFIGCRPLLQGEFVRRFFFPLLDDYRVLMDDLGKIKSILINVVKRHEETFKEDIRDVVDSYFKERNDRFIRNDPTAEFFTDSSLVTSLIHIIGDGTVSISIFISSFFHALLEHPEEQAKLYDELEEVVGPRQPTLEDRNKLPYMTAFIYEVIRTSNLYPLFPGSECTKETTLNGHPVPKGSIILINVWSCHRDAQVFEDPDTFNPSRYIPEPGNPRDELPIVFGVGKRSCTGESFTMTLVFLILSTVIKNFHLKRSNVPFQCPKMMEIIVVSRKSEHMLNL